MTRLPTRAPTRQARALRLAVAAALLVPLAVPAPGMGPGRALAAAPERPGSPTGAPVVTAAAEVLTPAGRPLPSEVDLATVLRLAREASPLLQIEREAVAGAEARRITAGVLPNPRIALSRARPSSGSPTLFDGRSQTDTSIEFPLLIAGQRAARIEAAERWIEAARARVQVSENQLAEEAGVAFLAILAAQARIDTLTAALEQMARIRDIVAGREAGGLASRYDVARVEVERGALEAQLAAQVADRADATGALAVLLGVPGWMPQAVGALEPYAEPAAAGPMIAGSSGNAEDRARLAQAHPSTVAAAREQNAAAAEVAAAQRERWPVPSIGVGRQWTSEPYGAANFLGLSVEIPIFDTRRGPLEEARSGERAAQLRRALVEAQVTASLARHETVVLRRREALTRFDSDAAQRMPMLQTMAEDAYRFGRSTILEWLDATRTLYEQQLVRVDLQAGLAEAQVRLRAAQGLLGSAGW